MKIAVATANGKLIRKGHFGSSRYFQIIEILNGEIVNRELRRNPYTETDDTNHSHGQAGPILDLLGDCSLFMGRSMGKKSVAAITAKQIDCVITKLETVELALATYLKEADQEFKFYDTDSRKFISCREREMKMGLIHGK
jgi:predicted Fe-Mo cluster-binding NifX family protein